MRDTTVVLRIYLGEQDQYQREPLFKFIVRKARARQLAGATVLRGVMGFGRSGHLHTNKILRLSMDLPVIVEIIDRADKIDALLEELAPIMERGMVTVKPLEEVRHVQRSSLVSSDTDLVSKEESP